MKKKKKKKKKKKDEEKEEKKEEKKKKKGEKEKKSQLMLYLNQQFLKICRRGIRIRTNQIIKIRFQKQRKKKEN